MVSFARAERFLFDLENIISDGVSSECLWGFNPSDGPVPRNLEDGFEGADDLRQIARADRLEFPVYVCLAP
jgi:hypothetical protein